MYVCTLQAVEHGYHLFYTRCFFSCCRHMPWTQREREREIAHTFHFSLSLSFSLLLLLLLHNTINSVASGSWEGVCLHMHPLVALLSPPVPVLPACTWFKHRPLNALISHPFFSAAAVFSCVHGAIQLAVLHLLLQQRSDTHFIA